MDFPLGRDKLGSVRVLLALSVMSVLVLSLACASTGEPQEMVESQDSAAAAGPSMGEPMAETGNEVGDRIPDFTLDLVDGTKVTSASLKEQGEPAFLFFFSTT